MTDVTNDDVVQMDHQGFIDISLIASFNRIKNLTFDLNLVRETMGLTPLLQVVGDRVRLRFNWAEWLLPRMNMGRSATGTEGAESGLVTVLPSSTSVASTAVDIRKVVQEELW